MSDARGGLNKESRRPSGPPAIFVAALISVAALAALLFLAASSEDRSPFSAPGDTWTAGLLSGHEIHLMPGGTFAVREWCDVCLDEKHTLGEWWKEDGAIVLAFPDGAVVRLQPSSDGSCATLQPAQSNRLVGSEPFYRFPC
jgi:hypothetical protein